MSKEADIKKDLTNEVNKKLVEVQKAVVSDLRNLSPVDTGALQAGWNVKQDKSDDPSLTIENKVDYALYVNNGTSTQKGLFIIEEALAKNNIQGGVK